MRKTSSVMLPFTAALFAVLTALLGPAAAQDTASVDTLSVQDTVAADTAGPKLVVIPVEGDVDPAMAAFIGRAVREALAQPDAVAVLAMDTFGGRVDAAFQIVDTLLQYPGDRIVSFVKNKAISAGALIALAGGSLYMREGTTIGDVAPITVGEEGPRMLGEKFQSPLRAKFRSLAKRNGYPATLAESMVTATMIVYRVEFPDTVEYLDSIGLADLPEERSDQIVSRTTVVARGELLTMDNTEAKELGFSEATVSGVEELADSLGLSGARIERLERNWSEVFVTFINTIAPILMLLGFAGLYIESKTPGFGAPGIIGVICLALVFGGQYLVGMANYTEALLIGAGLLLLAVEVFIIPGFGIAGIAGILLLAVGMVLSFQGFVIPKPEFPWQWDLFRRNLLTVGFSLLGSVVLLVVFFVYIFPSISRRVSGPYLSATMAGIRSDTGAPARTIALGDKGEVVKPLRPSGLAVFGNEELDVVADGEFLAAGEKVVVTRIEGNRIVVAKESSSG
ncbi:MAG: serine protease [Chitinivibrionales bacterium]|nr:serine protease [Chitinivibrionales bacterium]